MEDVESMDQLIASGANLYKDIADNYFGKTKTGILSLIQVTLPRL
jgi:hypothetical protein